MLEPWDPAAEPTSLIRVVSPQVLFLLVANVGMLKTTLEMSLYHDLDQLYPEVVTILHVIVATVPTQGSLSTVIG